MANIYRIPLISSLSNASKFVPDAGLLVSHCGYVSTSHSAQRSVFFTFASKGNRAFAIALSAYFGKQMKGERQKSIEPGDCCQPCFVGRCVHAVQRSAAP